MTNISKKVGIAIMVAVFVVAMCFSMVILPSKVYAGTINVPANYPTIQAAIDAANPGDTINVAAGTYTPTSTIIVNKNGLKLFGPQADVDPRPSYGSSRTPGPAAEAVIDGTTGELAIIIKIDAGNVVINGFEVKSGTGDMINQTDPHTGTIIKYCIIHDGNGDEGVQLKKCTNGILEYNYVYDIAFPGDALNISDGSTNCSIRYNEVYDIGSENAAIYVYYSTDMEIVGNLVYHVTQNDGIKLGAKGGADASKTGGLIKDNTIYDVEQDGITVYMSGVTIEGNEIYNSRSENGVIYLAYAIRNINIHDNSVHDNVLKTSKHSTAAGIFVESEVDAASVTVNNNNIFNNTPYGVTNEAADLLDATGNWWGDASGPSGEGLGTGDAVSTNVDFDPWLTNPVGYVPPPPVEAEEEEAKPEPEKEKPKPEKPKPKPWERTDIGYYEKTDTGFSTMFYSRFFRRPPDQAGLDAWTARLESGAITGAELVHGFIFGEECQARISDYTSEEFITFLYKTLFTRAPEDYGFDAWLARMSAGMTREEVVYGFTHSEEFVNLCILFGIIPYEGYISTEE